MVPLRSRADFRGHSRGCITDLGKSAPVVRSLAVAALDSLPTRDARNRAATARDRFVSLESVKLKPLVPEETKKDDRKPLRCPACGRQDIRRSLSRSFQDK